MSITTKVIFTAMLTAVVMFYSHSSQAEWSEVRRQDGLYFVETKSAVFKDSLFLFTAVPKSGCGILAQNGFKSVKPVSQDERGEMSIDMRIDKGDIVTVPGVFSMNMSRGVVVMTWSVSGEISSLVSGNILLFKVSGASPDVDKISLAGSKSALVKLYEACIESPEYLIEHSGFTQS